MAIQEGFIWKFRVFVGHRREQSSLTLLVLAISIFAMLFLVSGAAIGEPVFLRLPTQQEPERQESAKTQLTNERDQSGIEAENGKIHVTIAGDTCIDEDQGLQGRILGFCRTGSAWKGLIGDVLQIEAANDEDEWPKFNVWRIISAAILTALASGSCAVAGLGGGGLFVPIANLVLQFNSKTSVVLSNFLIFGGTSVGVALSLFQDRPTDVNKTLVDFDIAILLLPNMLLGISIGVILNRLFPNWLIALVLTVALIFISMHTTKKGLKLWANENHKASAKGKGKRKGGEKRGELKRSNTASEKALTEALLGYYKSLSSRYPVNTILALLFVWLSMFVVQILKGGHGNPGLLAVRECGVGYWLLTATQIPVAIGVTTWVIYHLPESSSTGLPENVEAQQDQFYEIERKQGLSLSGMALLAGIMAGMLGVGGAMIINPLLLSAGVHPQVTVATTLFTVLFSSSMSVAQYWLLGHTPIVYALVGALISAVSAGIGILGLQRIIKKYGRPSLLVFAVAIVLGLSALLMCVFGSLKVWEEYKSGAYMGFSYPC